VKNFNKRSRNSVCVIQHFCVKFTISNELSYNGNYYLELWKRRNQIRADLINCGDNYPQLQAETGRLCLCSAFFKNADEEFVLRRRKISFK
jgi:hypothetical protein